MFAWIYATCNISKTFRLAERSERDKSWIFRSRQQKRKISHCPRSEEKFFWGYPPRLLGYRPFVVLSPAWKVLRLSSENFSRPPSPVRASHLVCRYGRVAEACFDFWLFRVACADFFHQLVGHADCKFGELGLGAVANYRHFFSNSVHLGLREAVYVFACHLSCVRKKNWAKFSSVLVWWWWWCVCVCVCVCVCFQ